MVTLGRWLLSLPVYNAESVWDQRCTMRMRFFLTCFTALQLPSKTRKLEKKHSRQSCTWHSSRQNSLYEKVCRDPVLKYIHQKCMSPSSILLCCIIPSRVLGYSLAVLGNYGKTKEQITDTLNMGWDWPLQSHVEFWRLNMVFNT